LSVQVFARGSDRPALDVSFTHVDFSVPDDANFTFRPPGDVKLSELPQPTGPAGHVRRAEQQTPTTIGTGWTTITKFTGIPSLDTPGQNSAEIGAIVANLPEVSGSWGKGRLFTSDLVTGLLTDDGRAYIGAVDPDLLYQAAAQK
jgi:hypothetical protein